jgi:lipoprotein NlpI
MKTWPAVLLSLLLCACASPSLPPSAQLFNDHLFAAPSQPIRADEVLAVSEEMKQYLHHDIARELRSKGRQRGLFDALYTKGRLRLEYDSSFTRNAAQTFAARSGNCLSLVIMTAALAKELGLSVRYNSVSVDDIWSRSGNIYFYNTYVNIGLGMLNRSGPVGASYDREDWMTIDFLPNENVSDQRARSLDERTVVAMYMNNRAAELLAQGQPNEAYWWVREAIGQDPGFVSGYNTLGVIYRNHGNLPEAEQVLRVALEHDSSDTLAMYNLAETLRALGRDDEAGAWTRQLARLEPYAPFYFFKLGFDAAGRLQSGKRLVPERSQARSLQP